MYCTWHGIELLAHTHSVQEVETGDRKMPCESPPPGVTSACSWAQGQGHMREGTPGKGQAQGDGNGVGQPVCVLTAQSRQDQASDRGRGHRYQGYQMSQSWLAEEGRMPLPEREGCGEPP